MAAYAAGIFPWFEKGQPILWWSPNPRMVLQPAALHVSRSLAKAIRLGVFEVQFDTAFARVIQRCSEKRRPGQRGTWITPDMLRAYQRLHELGLAHSVEAWHEGELVGGLYGVSLGGAFFGESMYADAPDASKVAFVILVQQLQAWGMDLVDCQVATSHLARFGAVEVPRGEFLERLRQSIERPTKQGRWQREVV